MSILKCREAEFIQLSDDIEFVVVKADYRTGEVTVGITTPPDVEIEGETAHGAEARSSGLH